MTTPERRDATARRLLINRLVAERSAAAKNA